MPPKALITLGENVTYERDGNIAIVRIDLAYRGTRSATGKSVRVASTMGNHALPDMPAVVLGINAYTKE